MIWQMSLGLGLGIAVSLAAWRFKALTCSGAVSAAVMGGLVFGLGGLPWACPLLAFFISSSLLSRLVPRTELLSARYAKGARRDWSQVAANGGLGVILVLLQFWGPDLAWPWLAFLGAMAAVNADTWATELGPLSRSQPRLITTGRPVAPGTSGGVTWLGTGAALAGAVFMGGIGILFGGESAWMVLLVTAAAGLGGSTVDSLLGASWQVVYYCPRCQQTTEQHPIHACNAPTHYAHGWRWLNNDLVNGFAALVGAGLALLVFVAAQQFR